jgi:crotonyl-CoA carboxylase/reductase
MLDNKHLPGNMGVLVCAQKPGLRTLEEVQELSGTL